MFINCIFTIFINLFLLKRLIKKYEDEKIIAADKVIERFIFNNVMTIQIIMNNPVKAKIRLSIASITASIFFSNEAILLELYNLNEIYKVGIKFF